MTNENLNTFPCDSAAQHRPQPSRVVESCHATYKVQTTVEGMVAGTAAEYKNRRSGAERSGAERRGGEGKGEEANKPTQQKSTHTNIV